MHMRLRALEHEEAVVVNQFSSPIQMHECSDVFAVFVVDELRASVLSPGDPFWMNLHHCF